jgi:CRP-like cAMP-binding protein
LISEFVASKKKFIDWATNSSMQRVARLILSLEQRLEERGLAQNGSFHFPLRYRHISDALGMTQVHVNRVMTTLRSEGIIELEKQILHIKQHRELVAASK